MVTRVYLLAITILLALPFFCKGQIGAYGPCAPVIRNAELMFDGPVNKMALQDNFLYIGGSFNTVGRFTGGFIELRKKTGAAVLAGQWPWPYTNNATYAIAGKAKSLIIYGSFTKAGDSARSYIACIDSEGIVTNFKPVINGIVNTALIYNGKLYIGGYFTMVNGQNRNRLASFDLATETLTSWNPNVQNTATGALPCRIDCMLEYNGLIYVGGAFNRVGAANRKNIAAIDTGTGIVNSWAPEAYFTTGPDYGTVTKMLRFSNGLYYCGQFDYTAGQNRHNIALVNINTGVAHSWNPNPDLSVLALAAKGDTLYVGGGFQQISGQPRPLIASYNMNSVNISLLPLTINSAKKGYDYVTDILPLSDTLFIAGHFDTINSQFRKNLAAVHVTNGTTMLWKSHTNGEVKQVTNIMNKLYIGGLFSSAGRRERVNLAQFDVDADTITGWNPLVYGEVRTINPGGKVVYIGGDFLKVNNIARAYNAAIRKADASLTSWDPGLPEYLIAVREYKNDIYLAGTFNSIKGQTRYGLAKTDTTGAIMPWIGLTKPGSKVYGMQLRDDQLYLGGQFTEITGMPRKNFGIVDLTTGTASAVILNNDTPVYVLEKDDSTIQTIDAGDVIQKIDRNNFRRYRTTGPAKTNDVAILYSNTKVSDDSIRYFYGGSGYLGHLYFIFRFNPVYSSVGSGLFNGSVINTMEVYGNKLYMGGNFTDHSIGVAYSMLYSLPFPLGKAYTHTDTTILCNSTTSMIRVRSYRTYDATYRWIVNGLDINNPLPYYNFTPKNQDNVFCIVTTPPTGCLGASLDTSNNIRYTVIPVVTPTISINGPVEEENGTTVTVKAIVNNAATGYTIGWFNKGASIGTTTVDSITYIKGAGTDSIYAIITPRTDTCYVTDTSALITVNEKPVGISSVSGDSKIQGYPNPFENQVRIKGLDVGDVLIVYDVTGRKVLSGVNHYKTDHVLHTGCLLTGTYVLKITDSKGISRKNMLLQKQ